MIVSLAIFAVVAVIAVGALVRVVGANRRAQSMQAAATGLNFALDAMSREIRVGAHYHCETAWASNDVINPDAGGPGSHTAKGCASIAKNSLITFDSQKQADAGGGNTCRLIVAYLFVGNGTSYDLRRAQQNSCNQNLQTTDFSSIIPQNMTLTDYRLAVDSADASNPYSWTFVRLAGIAGDRVQDQTTFDVQTLISQRISD